MYCCASFAYRGIMNTSGGNCRCICHVPNSEDFISWVWQLMYSEAWSSKSGRNNVKKLTRSFMHLLQTTQDKSHLVISTLHHVNTAKMQRMRSCVSPAVRRLGDHVTLARVRWTSLEKKFIKVVLVVIRGKFLQPGREHGAVPAGGGNGRTVDRTEKG